MEERLERKEEMSLGPAKCRKCLVFMGLAVHFFLTLLSTNTRPDTRESMLNIAFPLAISHVTGINPSRVTS